MSYSGYFSAVLRFSAMTISLWLSAVACQRGGPHQSIVKKPTTTTTATPTGGLITYEQVRPLFTRFCSSCHPSRAPHDWLNYERARAFALNGRMLDRVVKQKTMPQPGSPESRAITDQDRDLIRQWIEAGAPLSPAAPPGTTTAESQPPPPQSEPDRITLILTCTTCHGDFGLSENPLIPNLAGQRREYLARELQEFKSGERKDDVLAVMNGIAEGLSEADIEFLSTYYNRLSPPPREIVDQLAEADKFRFTKGEVIAKESCNLCHLDESTHRSVAPNIPNLAGQHPEYMTRQLDLFKKRQRPATVMSDLLNEDPLAQLTQEDYESLSLYFNSVNPRPGQEEE